MIVIGLGSNKGDRLQNLRKALSYLKSHPKINVCHVSPVYQSEAQLPENAPRDWQNFFFNAALTCQTELTPQALLAELKLIEQHMGRLAREHWAPRVIDLDIVLWGNETIDTGNLSIPHKRLHERPFVLWPVLDIFSDWQFPREIVASWGLRFSQEAPFKTHQVPYRIDGSAMMGVLNITPDSFSDGGLYFDLEKAIDQAQKLFAEGAEVIDIGAESTRPGSQALSPIDEWQRLEPVVKALVAYWGEIEFRPQISVDTRHAAVAKQAILAGCDWINDVTGFEDAAMLAVVKDANVILASMHSLSIPPSKTLVLPFNRDSIEVLVEWGERQLEKFSKAGIGRERLVLDPGIGFGKTPEQNLTLIQRANELKQHLSVPLLVGHSRKSFMANISPAATAERDLETAVATLSLFHQGVDYIRVHDVACSLRAVAMQQRLDSIQSRQEYNNELFGRTEQTARSEASTSASLL